MRERPSPRALIAAAALVVGLAGIASAVALDVSPSAPIVYRDTVVDVVPAAGAPVAP